jgi:ketosteroid isomerase-like protein
LETEVKRVTAGGSVVAVEWVRRGAFTGSPWQGMPPTGKSFETTGAAFMEVKDGQVTHVIAYSDSAQLASAFTPDSDPAA